jgi:hypothetical protein
MSCNLLRWRKTRELSMPVVNSPKCQDDSDFLLICLGPACDFSACISRFEFIGDRPTNPARLVTIQSAEDLHDGAEMQLHCRSKQPSSRQAHLGSALYLSWESTVACIRPPVHAVSRSMSCFDSQSHAIIHAVNGYKSVDVQCRSR